MESSSGIKVVMVGPAWPIRGGISLFSDCLKKALKVHGANVTIVGFSRQYPDMLFPGKTQFIPNMSGSGDPGEKIIDTINPLTWLKAGKHIHALDPDVVIFPWWHIWFLPCFLFLLLYLRGKGVKTLFLCHNLRSHGSSSMEDGLVHGLLSRSDSIVFLSGYVKGMWRGKNPPAICLFHPIYDFTHVAEVKIREKWCGRLLLAGYGKSYKGLKLALSLLELDANLSLTVAGEFYEKSLSELLEKAVTAHGDRLGVIGEYVPDEELIALVDDHDMVLCPYTEATQSGIVALAMGRQRPVAATPAGGLPGQILPRAGCVSKAISAPSLYDAVQRVYQKTPLKWHRDISSIKENFSWDLFVRKMFEEKV